MSTIADYSVFTKEFLAANNVDFSKLYTDPLNQGNSLRYFAVVPLHLDQTLTPREAMNFDWSKLGNDLMWNRVSCRDADGNYIGNIVRIQPGVREGSIRLVAKVAVPSESENDTADASYNTFVLLRTDSLTSKDLTIAVATISDGYRLHKHVASGNDPLDDVENANYVSFTINHLNGYTSVDFNPDAYVTYDVTDALSRSIDGLHIAFDTASGDLKLLDKDGNVLDQANLPIKTDVIIADGEEGYKYVKTDGKQDIHAAKAWMPKGKTAWEAVPEAPYKMKHAALVMEKVSSRVFVDMTSRYNHPISTEPVQFDHVIIDNSIYMVTGKTEGGCSLLKVKGEAGEPFITDAVISGEEVRLNSQPDHTYTIIKNVPVDVDVIKGEDGVTPYVLAGTEGSGEFQAWSLDGKPRFSGLIVTFDGSSAASRVFVDMKSGSFPISTEPVQFDHVIIDNSIYMVTGKTEGGCSLRKVKGEAGEPFITGAVISGEGVILNGQTDHPYTIIKNVPVEADVIKVEGATYVLAGTNNPDRFQAWSLDGSPRFSGFIVTSEGSSTGGVLGITPDGTTLYTFDETAETHSEIHNTSGDTVRWLDIKPLTEGSNHTLKYGLEAFVWTVKDAEVKLNEPFFQQLNASLLALGFHEGDDIALGTNLPILASADGSPLNGVDADDYMHGETKNESGKTNKELREQEVDAQRANAREELVAWNKQHPELVEDRSHGTIIDYTGLDVRKGRITLGCGRVNNVAEDGDSPNVNYGIQMNDLTSNLDFTVSRAIGEVQFDADGHATDLTSSTLLSIEAGDYISGAPTCLILAEVGRELSGDPEISIVRTTTGFTCIHSYDASNGSRLTIHDYRKNISAVFNPNNSEYVPAIIEVQAIYTHLNAQYETVPAQQMHTYIGEWKNIPESESHVPDHPGCRFSCNKIEEWMTAVGLADPNTDEGVKLYVVIRVY